jgi:glycosyltransferase involved in cell wall biosynthesis
MTSEPLVSVVLPVWNREEWVARAIASVRAQSYPRIELIVVDDGSTDGTCRVAQSFGRSLTLLRQPHRGPYAARNLGVRHAAGELIALIDSDDAWYPDRLERQIPLLRDPTVGLVFGDATLVDHDGTGRSVRSLTAFQITPPRHGWVMDHFAYGNFIPTSSVLVRRRCFWELGEFCERAQLSADFVMWFRIALRYRLEYVDAPLFEYALHAGGISRDLLAALRSRIELFEGMLGDAPDRRTRDELLRILFNLRLHLALARLRRARGEAVGALADGARAFRLAPRASLAWAMGFVGNQVRVRLRRRLPGRRASGPNGSRP